MELWTDSIDSDAIRNASKMFRISGVTTNPSILSRSDRTPEDTMKMLLDIQPGYLAVQVIGDTHESIVNQARKLHFINNKIIIKIPACKTGYSAIKALNSENILTMATGIFEPIQVYLSSLSGAKYAALYLGRIEKYTGDSTRIIAETLSIIKNNNSELKLLAASIPSNEQILNCLLSGVHAITLPVSLYEGLISDNEHTTRCVENFSKDWISNKICKNSDIFS